MASPLPELTFTNHSNRDLAAFAVTQGVPLREGCLQGDEGLAVRLPDGATHPVQTRVLERHADGSVRWLLLDFVIPVARNASGTLQLIEANADDPAADSVAITVAEADDSLTITTPRLAARISRTRFSLFESLEVDGQTITTGGDILIDTPRHRSYSASAAKHIKVAVIEHGPQRAVVEAFGRHTAKDGSELFDFRVLYTFQPHEPGVKLSYKFTNREAPETGVEISRIAITCPTSLGNDASVSVRQVAHGANWWPRLVEITDKPVTLTAGGAINEEARTRYGNAAEDKVVISDLDLLGENLEDYPYFLRPGNARTDMTGGLRQCYPYLGASDTNAALVAFFLQMGENYPKAVTWNNGQLTFDIYPASAKPLRFRRGMSKEHDFYIAPFSQPQTGESLEAVYHDRELAGLGIWGSNTAPVAITLDPEYVRQTQVLELHRWLPFEPDRYANLEERLGSFASPKAGARGMLDFGDYVNADRSWCHNNENDAILDGIREYFRRQDPGSLAGAIAKARHNATVDHIAYDPDPLRDGAMPAHCPEHTDGSAYPSHMWVDGLLAAYCITGNRDLLAAAQRVGDNLLRWQKLRPEIFYADSRECGWPMLAFLRLNEHDHDSRWLDACQQVVQHYADKLDENGEIKYALPHGLGLTLQGYGEFIAWRAMFFYLERTDDPLTRQVLERCLPIESIWKLTPQRYYKGGWACNDFFPSWAAFTLTGDSQFLKGNIDTLKLCMKRGFPWKGMDVMHYLGELHRADLLDDAIAGL